MKIYNISEETGLKLKTADYTGLNPGFEYFNPPQSKFVKENLHKKDCNLIIAWSTSAGKTVAAELKIENQLARGNKIVYACPLKALAEEKIKRFKKLFPYRNIEIFTGDYNDFDKRKYKAKNADIAIVTTELLDSITRNKTLTYYLLNSTGTVIIDEFHIIATERGPAVESATIRLPEHISVMLLSATVPNTEEVAEWIYSLNKKETYIFESSYRPVKIDWELIHINYKLYGYWIKHALAKLIELIFDYDTAGGLANISFAGGTIIKDDQSVTIPTTFTNGSIANFRVSGQLTYNGDASRPICTKNSSVTTVYLKNAADSTIAYTTTADTAGNYVFSSVAVGNYFLDASSTIDTKYGYDNTDAFLIYGTGSSMTGIIWKAANVNEDNFVDNSDAFIVYGSVAGGNNRGPSWSAPEWVFENPTVTVSGSNVTQDFVGLSSGDSNGDFVPVP